MGVLLNGEWRDALPQDDSSDGRFRRKDASFRNWVTANGDAGTSGEAGFKAESGRYHFYVSYACPWAHRALISGRSKD